LLYLVELLVRICAIVDSIYCLCRFSRTSKPYLPKLWVQKKISDARRICVCIRHLMSVSHRGRRRGYSGGGRRRL